MATDNTITKSKAFAIRTIMADPKLSKKFINAISSPFGSSNKSKIKTILKTFQRSNANYLNSKMGSQDGKGGSPDSSINNLNTPLAKYAPPGFNLLPYQQNKSNTNLSMDYYIDPTTGQIVKKSKVEEPTQLTQLNSSISSKFNAGINPDTGNIIEYSPLPFDLSKRTQNKTITPSTPVETITPTAPIGVTNYYNIPSLYNTPSLPSGASEPSGADASGAVELQKVKSKTAEIATNIYNNLGEDALDIWYKSLSPDEQTKNLDVYNATKQGLGAETFAVGALQNKEQLKRVLNLPDEIINTFPVGNLSQQLGKLQDNITKKYQLDTMLNDMTSKLNQGLSVQKDVTNYIRLNDDYLGKLDKMIYDFDQMEAYTDTSNPVKAKRFANYKNYLELLKGRQLSRYTNYLESSVNDYDIKLKRSENIYNANLNAAEKEFTKEKAITTETYTTVKKMLTDLYDNVSNKRELLKNKEENQLKQLKNYTDTFTILDDVIKEEKNSPLTLDQFAQQLGNILSMSIVPNKVKDEYQEYLDKLAKATTTEFTDQELKKLEQAGLLNAPRQEQLDYLFKDNSFDLSSIDVGQLAESLKNR